MQSDYLYSTLFNTNIAFYVVTKCSDVTVFVEAVSCHNAFVLYLALTSVGLSVLLCSIVIPSVTG